MYPLKLFFDFLRDKTYRGLVISTFSVLVSGTLVYHFVEGWRWLDSVYFSVITLATVGYGDFSPQTDFGKIFTIFYVLTGIGILFGFIDTFYKHRISKFEELKEKRKNKSK
ncbi:two pore domain potassium channel family protein [Maribellus comscasis]|uniref:Two pore domain potassium channel family protein n=1 Tax=Maribellus comscasis TaxID=2681766 RepID=A0A6I6JW21_9BACT|nr:potassium channel family protein [Maribellus comscasis]QGY44287.1 two pore domain potassium channel family protein [Maribellus comscasis]